MKRQLTYEFCKETAKKCKTKSELHFKDQSVYHKAMKMGWLDTIGDHFENGFKKAAKKRTKWDLDACIREANKYTYLLDFRKNSRTAYAKAKKCGWSEVFKNLLPQPLKWTFKVCKERAKMYEFRYTFQKNERGAYEAALRNGWLDEICEHMSCGLTNTGSWTKTDFCRRAGKSANFYLLYCEDDIEWFYKFGITTQSVERRYNSFSLMPYDYEILILISQPPEKIWDLEKHWLYATKNHRYVPEISFGGHQKECFRCNRNNNLLCNVYI